MTHLVEAHILLQLFQGTLAADALEHLDVFEDDLGDDQLCLPVVLGIHVPPLTSDVSDTIIIGDG